MTSPLAAGRGPEEDSWESTLLPPMRALRKKQPPKATAPIGVGTLIASAAVTPTRAVPDQRGRAKLLSLEMINFKCFEERTVSFNSDGLSCIVGPNSSGKSSIFDAINFITLRPGKCIRGLVRRCRPAILTCCVTALFETERSGKVTLRREVIIDSPTEHRVTYAASLGNAKPKDMLESEYALWIEKVLCWKESDVVVNQFSLIEQSSLANLLAKLPHALDQLEADGDTRPPMLKRRCIGSDRHGLKSRVTGIRTTAEAWVGRRLDELYRELSREALDAQYQTWGEGGQACLRRLPDGSFTIFVSHQQGLAALGKGTPLESISGGNRDLCALALLLTLPGLSAGSAGLQDVLPPLAILDEPDSRLDKRGALCLRQLLSGPLSPAQCMVMSLNNHRAFNDLPGTVELSEVVIGSQISGDGAEIEEDPYGDMPLRGRSRRT